MVGVLPVSAVELLDQLTTAIALFDADLRFIYANPAFIECTGIRRWRDCPLAILGDAAADVAALIQRMRSGNSVLTLRDFALRTREPAPRVDVAVGNWNDGAIVLELHAVTMETLHVAAPQIAQSLRELAHEVKNPLAGLRGAAQLLKRRVAEPDMRHLIDLIIAEADRLAALTDRLLHPGGKPHLSVINLHEVVERARVLMAADAASTVKLERDYDPSLPTLRGDADRLLQLLLNLLRNALQAAAKNILMRTRVERAVVIDGKPLRLALRLDVIDDGSGVPDGLRESLFLPLVSGRVSGSGLGLALAQEIAHEHGGQLGFHSRPGHTVFSLILPLEQSSD